MANKSKTQTYNDGVLTIYSLNNDAEGGSRPNQRLVAKTGLLRYAERVVGMGRYWAGQQSKARIDWLVRTQRIEAVSVQDVAVRHDGNQYKIVQIQYPRDVEPSSMDLSLERVTENYDNA